MPTNGTGLLHLFAEWQAGARIEAGTAMLAAVPTHSTARAFRTCGDCQTWVFGSSNTEAMGRLARHRQRSHG